MCLILRQWCWGQPPLELVLVLVVLVLVLLPWCLFFFCCCCFLAAAAYWLPRPQTRLGCGVLLLHRHPLLWLLTPLALIIITLLLLLLPMLLLLPVLLLKRNPGLLVWQCHCW